MVIGSRDKWMREKTQAPLRSLESEAKTDTQTLFDTGRGGV